MSELESLQMQCSTFREFLVLLQIADMYVLKVAK